jgi:hypothetical protein
MDRSTSRTTTRKALKHTAQPHPDAALLRLMAEHAIAQARVEAGEILPEADPGSMSETAFYRLCTKVSDIEDAILTYPTHTPEGLGVKARIAARYMQTPEDWGLCGPAPVAVRVPVHRQGVCRQRLCRRGSHPSDLDDHRDCQKAAQPGWLCGAPTSLGC